MGVKGGVVVWCLLLAGLLLLAVTCTAERDTEKEKEEEIRWCKKDCDWKAGEDTGKARECKEQCERRRHGHELLQEDGGSFDRCVSKCRGHGGWWGKERWDRCRQICRQSQEGEGGDDDTDEGGHNADDRCERMCQHYHDRREKKQCMKGCRYGESVLIAFDDGREHGDRCQTQCKRFRPGSYDRQQCVEKCQCQQKEGEEAMNLNHHGGGGHGHGDRCQAQCKRFRPGSYDRWQCTERCRSHQQDEEEEEVMNHHGGGGHGHGGSSCEQKCQQRYRHEYDKQQCVRDCKSGGGGGGAGGRGREGDERQHDTGMVVEAILEDV